MVRRRRIQLHLPRQTVPLLRVAAGRFLVRTPDVTHHEGRQFDVHVIAEFPSVAKATEALESDEYKSIVAHRTDNSDTEYGSFMLVEGLE